MLGQAVGTAAAIAVREKADPSAVRAKHLAELQATLEDDDQMLPFRWRKVSALTAAAKTAPENEPLRNGVDRMWDGAERFGGWSVPFDAMIAVAFLGAGLFALLWRSKSTGYEVK